MRTLFSVIAAAAFALTIFAGGCGKEDVSSPPVPGKKETAAIKTKAAPKVPVKYFTGTIESLDEDAGTLTLKGPKETREFKADRSAKKDLDGVKIGDKVIVKHTGEMALSIMNLSADNYTRHMKEKEGPRKELGIVPKAD
jgi:hypothetical protein